MTHKQVLKIADVMARTKFSKTHIYRMITAGEFPAAAKLGERFTGWDADEIDDWITEKFQTAPRVTTYASLD